MPPKRKQMERTSRWRNFRFTWNCHEEADEKAAVEYGDKISTHFTNETRMQRYIFQLERAPSTGRLHYQGFFHTFRDSTFDLVRTFFTTLDKNIAPWIGESTYPTEAWDYCSKPDTRVAGPWMRGERPSQGSRTDLTSFVESASLLGDGKCTIGELRLNFINVEARYTKYFDRVITRYVPARSVKTYVIVCCGPPGTGKSYKCRELSKLALRCTPFLITLREGVKGTTQSNWFDGLDQHESGGKAVIIDELDRYQLPVGLFNQLGDEYPLRVPVKGSFVNWCAEVLFITSNRYLDELYPQYAASTSTSVVGSVSGGSSVGAVTGFVDASVYRRVDEYYHVDYHPKHQPDAHFTNAADCAVHAIWTRIK